VGNRCRCILIVFLRSDFVCSICTELVKRAEFLNKSLWAGCSGPAAGQSGLCHLSVRGHQSEIVLGVLVVVLRADDIPRPGFLLG
jgi:hypothetical protein